MINTQDLEKIVALAIYTGHIDGEKPVSLMIISDRPESGKTEVVNKYCGTDGIRFLSDVTAFGLWRDYHTEIAKGTLRHLIIPEFLAPLSRRSETVGSFITTLGMLIEEGVISISTGFQKPIKLKAPSAIGAIICMPRNAFEIHKIEWENNGFMSRFMVVSYKYDRETVYDIWRSITNREYLHDSKIKLKLPEKNMNIDIPEDIAETASKFVFEQTEGLRKSHKGYGFRELKNMIKMLQANVILDIMNNDSKRMSVNNDDLIEIQRLSYLINQEFNVLKGEVSNA